ncbi:sugar O-acetyltransferase [Anaeromicropila populeti]|uniref:Acetyltransferase n=1 Tax=Anaeromicropila populeti TaxID=37658 RepID=A0A1I6KJ31_9FIRM|nr:sugar O-acetyltransferase [Anaeromicropila populeti]SFR91249.1 maltose O-acetyltransferase [Anaeromicropila populeti]
MEFKEILNTSKMYDDMSKKSNEVRNRAYMLSKQYNACTDDHEREKILDQLFFKHGKNVRFENGFFCEYGINISIGNDFFGNFDCLIFDCASVTIGNNVLFGPRVGIFCGNHATHPEERLKKGCYSKPVVVGDNVWIGAGSIVTQGVTIGNNSIIGAGSVVTKSIPCDVIAAGNPCKVIRAITEADRTGYNGEEYML